MILHPAKFSRREDFSESVKRLIVSKPINLKLIFRLVLNDIINLLGENNVEIYV